MHASKSTPFKAAQIIATSHDLTPNGGLVMEIPLFQGNLGWWNIKFGQIQGVPVKPSMDFQCSRLPWFRVVLRETSNVQKKTPPAIQ